MKEKVAHIVSLITQKPEIFLLENAGKEKLWDSLKNVEIIIALEDEFDVSFAPEEIAQLKTIDDITAIIKSKQ